MTHFNNLLKTTLFVAVFVLSGTIARAQVTVTATAGVLGPVSYTTLNAAFVDINAGLPQGAITVSISANTTETGACVLNGSGAGPAIYTSVTIRPTVDGVFISGPTVTGRGLIELNGADNVTIDGDNANTGGINRNLSIVNTAANSVARTSCIRLATSTLVLNCDNVIIRNCNVTGSGTARNASGIITETVTWGIVSGGSASTVSTTTAPSALATGTSSASGQTVLNLLINNNNVQTVSRGICVQGSAATVAVGLVISSNVVGNATAGAPDQVWNIGITAQGSSNGIITGNIVYVEGFIQASAATKGIDIGTVSANGTFTIERNEVRRVINNDPTTWPATGISILGGTNNLIRNNFVGGIANNMVSGTGAFGELYAAYGIRLAGGTGHTVIYNTVHLTGTIPGTTSSNLTACLNLASTTVTGCNVRNNVFSNQMTGGNLTAQNMRHTCLLLPSGATSALNLTINNNRYYQGTTTVSTIAQSGYVSGTSTDYLAANFSAAVITPATNLRSYTSTLSAAGTNDNASGASAVAPPLISATNLHADIAAPNLTDLNGGAVVIAGTTTDFDLDVRDASTPDIGADEFVSLGCVAANGGTVAPSTSTVCANQTVVMSSTGATTGAGITYQWMIGTTSGGPYVNVTGGSGATTVSYTTAALSTGTYYYVLQTTCTNGPLTGLSNQITVVVNGIPSVSVTPTTTTYCSGSPSFPLNASGGSTYTWGPAAGLSATTGASVTALPISSVTYTVTGTDANGCTGTATSVVIWVPGVTGVVASSSASSICAGDSIDLSSTVTDPITLISQDFTSLGAWSVVNAPSAPLVTAWGSITSPFSYIVGSLSFTNFSTPNAGNFYMTNSDAGGSGSTTNSQLISPVFSTMGMTAASLSFEQLYQRWASGDVNVSVDISTDGGATWSLLQAYTADQGVITANAQVATATTINLGAYLNQPSVRLRYNYVAVWGYYWILDNIVVSGNMTNTFAWTSTPAGFSSSLQNPADVVPTATANYNVVVTNSLGCASAMSTVNVVVNAIPTVVANATATAVCDGSPVTLSGSGAATYTWTASVTDNVAFTPLTTDTYTVTGTDANGCVDMDNITVTVNPLPTVVANATATTICDGAPVTFTGSGATSYTWAAAMSVTNNVAVNPTATDTYTVTGTDANGCQNTDMITVTVNPLPTVVANATATTICDGAPVTFTGSGATTYTWAAAITVTDNVAVNPTATDTYTVTGTDGNGCQNTDMITVTVNPLPIVVANATATTVCDGTPVTVTGSGATTYTWAAVMSVTDNVAFTPTATDTYTVTGTDGNGCTGTDMVTVTVNPLPVVSVSFAMDTVCLNGGMVTLTGETPTGGTWSGAGVSGNSFDPMVAGLGWQPVTYSYTDANSCTGSITDSLNVDVCNGVIPVAFVNDVTVYPNPNEGQFTIQLSAVPTSSVQVEVTNELGQVISAFTMTGTTKEVNISTLESGVYFVRIINEGNVSVHRVVKQ